MAAGEADGVADQSRSPRTASSTFAREMWKGSLRKAICSVWTEIGSLQEN